MRHHQVIQKQNNFLRKPPSYSLWCWVIKFRHWCSFGVQQQKFAPSSKYFVLNEAKWSDWTRGLWQKFSESPGDQSCLCNYSEILNEIPTPQAPSIASQDANFSTPAKKVGRSRRRRFRLQFGAVRISESEEAVGEILDSWRHPGNHEWCSRVMQPAVAFAHLGTAPRRIRPDDGHRRPLRRPAPQSVATAIGAGCRDNTQNIYEWKPLDPGTSGTHHWTATFSHQIKDWKFLIAEKKLNDTASATIFIGGRNLKI
jgi:hypothetical protein